MRKNGQVRLCAVTLGLWAVVLGGQGLAQNDKTRANSYDDAWEDVALGNASWVVKARNTLAGAAGKTTGFVLQVGDSITHSNPYSQWARGGAGKTAEDSTVTQWMQAEVPLPGTQDDTSSKNGFYLAIADTVTAGAFRGMTASSGLTAGEILSGSGNGGTAMGVAPDGATARVWVADGATYTGNLNIATVALAFADAQFAFLMLGTNDASDSIAGATFEADLGAVIDALEAQDIVVILSTVPPHFNSALEDDYNTRIRAMAQARSLALVDYHAEIVARQPDPNWNGTLLQNNNVHPSADDGGANNSSSDPYATGGTPATHTTGTNCDAIGYLLRCWLTVQKMKEVKDYVIDLNDPPTGNPPIPAGLNATPGNGFVQLAWGASAGATGYNVYRSTTSGSGYALVQGNVATTSYTDTTVTNGTTYYYVVTALTPESGNSNQATATPSVGGGPAPVPSSSDDDDDGCSCGTVGLPGGFPLLFAALLGIVLVMIRKQARVIG